ncbi:hypothetical protein JOF53_007041 [Crossiella equi]|uniref:Uncharacterized protein n=1 Tax=Crossiella equi TaxID=130796 RepID=A0ABS5ANK7_9PSEU|nr:hypothetical protein [Crossiella equi]MBP2478169.1 hypothetical protein [Crossiella equi]
MRNTAVRRLGGVLTAALATTLLLLAVGATDAGAATSGWCGGSVAGGTPRN